MRLAADLALRLGCVIMMGVFYVGIGYLTCSRAIENRDHLRQATSPVVVLPAAQVQAMGALVCGVPDLHGSVVDAIVDRTVPRVYVSDRIDRAAPHFTMTFGGGGIRVMIRGVPLYLRPEAKP